MLDSSPVARPRIQMFNLPDWSEANATERPLSERDGRSRLAGPCVIRSSPPLDVPRFRSNGSDQRSRLVSSLVNAKAPPDAQDTSISFPAPVVKLLGAPLILPVCGDIPISQRDRESPLMIGKRTVLPAV